MRGLVKIRSLLCLAGVVAVLSTFVVASPATAIENETFGLTPYPQRVDGTERRTFAVPLEPGAMFEDSIRVYNRTDQPLDLILYAGDAESGLDGTISVGFRGSRPNGVGAWIDLERDSLKLPPHGEAIVPFRIDVKSADPVPDLGAIAVEHTTGGQAANLAERLHIVVRTSAPNTVTTSVRVRPLLLRSPWIILAIIGLVVALVIVWLGARRARRPKDSLVPSGVLRSSEPEITPAASKPVLRRLGETAPGTPHRRRQNSEVRNGRVARTTRAWRERADAKEAATDSRPILDDRLVDVDEREEKPQPRPQRKRTPRRPAKSTARGAQAPSPTERKKRYIPLDDL